MELVIKAPTVLKQSTGQASALASRHKRRLDAGIYKLLDCKPSAAGHFVIKFQSPQAADDGLAQYQSWWIYADDRVVLPVSQQSKALKVTYASQLDNKNQPNRTCNTSCHWMVLNFLKPGIYETDDEYWLKEVKPFGDSTDHNVHTRALAKNGIKSSWRYDLDFADIFRQIDRGLPVPIGIAHRGPIFAPAGGHIVLVVGYTANALICHDPFGKLPYTDWSSGANVQYSINSMAARWLLDGKDTGWGRIVD